MQKWEYTVVPVTPKLGPTSAREALNQQGEDGWEFVGMLPSDNLPLMVFKRPKQ